jgi:hypothetical protein
MIRTFSSKWCGGCSDKLVSSRFSFHFNVVTRKKKGFAVVLRAKWIPHGSSAKRKRSNLPSNVIATLPVIDHVVIIKFSFLFWNAMMIFRLNFYSFPFLNEVKEFMYFSSFSFYDPAISIVKKKWRINNPLGLWTFVFFFPRRPMVIEWNRREGVAGGWWHDAFGTSFISFVHAHRDCTRWRVCICVWVLCVFDLFRLRLCCPVCVCVYTWRTEGTAELMQHIHTRGLVIQLVDSSSPTIDQFGSVRFVVYQTEGGRPLPSAIVFCWKADRSFLRNKSTSVYHQWAMWSLVGASSRYR